MKNLFGEDVEKTTSTKKKIHVVTKAKAVKEEIKYKGLNEVYKELGDWIINKRGNKTP